MHVKQYVSLVGLTKQACGWSGPGMFEVDSDSEDPGSLHVYVDIHPSILQDQELLGVLQEIKEHIYTIWGNKQKGIQFFESYGSDSGIYVSICLDKGNPEDYRFCGSKTQIHRQIGNAVPPLMGYAFGIALNKMEQKR